MKTSALSSGSSGNCFYVEHNNSAVLVDAGISSKRIVERMSHLKLSPEKIKGIFITHEHIDHIRGTDVFARQFNIPIFATKKTVDSAFLCSNPELIQTIRNNEIVNINGMEIEAFSKSHNASDPVSYSITNGKKISVITDLGHPCSRIADNVSSSDFLYLESNHDVDMVDQGPYPYFLKKWIKGDSGHLSNTQAGLCVLENANPKLKNIVLSHLSLTNNTPQLALKTFNSLIKERYHFNPRVSLSLRDFSTPLFNV